MSEGNQIYWCLCNQIFRTQAVITDGVCGRQIDGAETWAAEAL